MNISHTLYRFSPFPCNYDSTLFHPDQKTHTSLAVIFKVSTICKNYENIHAEWQVRAIVVAVASETLCSTRFIGIVQSFTRVLAKLK